MADGTLKVGTITTSSGSGTITIGQSGETISGLGSNTPAFHVDTATTSLSTATHTTVLYTSIDRDTANLYSAATGKFTVTDSTTGYYFIYAAFGTEAITANRIQINLLSNFSGSDDKTITCETQSDTSGYPAPNVGAVIPLLSSGDFVAVQGYQNSGGTIALSGEANKNFFGGYRIIGA